MEVVDEVALRVLHRNSNAFHARVVEIVQGDLSQYVTALIAIEVDANPNVQLLIAPHEHMLLSVRLRAHADEYACYDGSGGAVRLTGLRTTLSDAYPPGDCATLFALLTPLGAMRLLRGRSMYEVPKVKAPLDTVLDDGTATLIERTVAQGVGLQEKLKRYASWLEQTMLSSRSDSVLVQRTAHAAMTIVKHPHLLVSEVAAQEKIATRQLERDFHRWLGVSPKQLGQAARLQNVVKLARSGMRLADVALEVGFADQSHMSRVVRELTGLSPRALRQSLSTEMSLAFRRATGGGAVYL
jgi:AraC-like DNA-binding protein